VRYANGARQQGIGGAQAIAGRATWAWDVPVGAAIGRAAVTASCVGAGTRKHTLLIVGASIPPRVDVVKQGFSVRERSYGGASVSYGLILENRSKNDDALGVSVLVNFVMADDKLIGSAVNNVSAIPAGGTYALGSDLSFPAGAPVARLEVVVQVSKRQTHALHIPPLANVRMLPGLYDGAYLGEIDGELINDAPAKILQNAQLSAVVFDAAGNVVGGGRGYAFAALPPSTRQVFKLTSGVTAIPFEKAATTQISVVPTWVSMP
jgi:hypothetical protein